jgi:methylmalonyl-CoA mutase cobalamin-binding domain/chain
MNELIKAILEGDVAASVAWTRQLRGQGVSVENIVTRGVEAAMSTLDAKCTLEQFNLLEIMLVGRAVMEIMKSLYPSGCEPANTRGRVVVATLEGDVHDLGKNIFKMVLIGNGYRVVDCGKDCPLPKLVDMARQESPLAVGVSGLITPIIPLVKKIKDALAAEGLDHVKVVAGGAALKQSSAEKLNVDFVADSAFDGVSYLDSIVRAG